jgi:hypothetical protein
METAEMKNLIVMMFLIAVIASVPFVTASDVVVADPLKYATESTGDNCEVSVAGKTAVVDCWSEIYLGDAIECPSDGGFCEPSYNVRFQTYCAFSFEKVRRWFRLLTEECDERRVEES